MGGPGALGMPSGEGLERREDGVTLFVETPSERTLKQAAMKTRLCALSWSPTVLSTRGAPKDVGKSPSGVAPGVGCCRHRAGRPGTIPARFLLHSDRRASCSKEAGEIGDPAVFSSLTPYLNVFLGSGSSL